MKNSMSYFLLSLRLISITLLVFLMIEPSILYNKLTNEKRINLYIDNSLSIDQSGYDADSLYDVVNGFSQMT